jgi:hypothetical protein
MLAGVFLPGGIHFVPRAMPKQAFAICALTPAADSRHRRAPYIRKIVMSCLSKGFVIYLRGLGNLDSLLKPLFTV